MKIREKSVVFITLAVLLTSFGLWIWWNNRAFEFELVEVFADSTNNGKIYFGFIQVNNYNEIEMYEYGKSFLTEHVTLDVLRQDLPVITILHFYNLDDTTTLTSTQQKKILKQYPNITNPEKYLQCVKNGFIFTGFSKKIVGINVPKDTLFKTTVIIPKNGIKAQDVMKAKKKQDKIDSVKVILKDSNQVIKNGNN